MARPVFDHIDVAVCLPYQNTVINIYVVIDSVLSSLMCRLAGGIILTSVTDDYIENSIVLISAYFSTLLHQNYQF